MSYLNGFERPSPNDRIRLIKMGDDPCPIPSGSMGTVTRVTRWTDETYQVSVDWDPDVGRSLALIWPIDNFIIVGRVLNEADSAIVKELLREKDAERPELSPGTSTSPDAG